MKLLISFYKYLKKGKKSFIIATIAGLLFGATSGLGIPVIFEKVFRRFFESPGEIQTPLTVVAIALALPMIFFVRGLLSFVNGYFMTAAGMSIMKELRQDIFRKIQYLPMSFFDKNSQGDLIARMAGDPGVVQNVILDSAIEFFKQPAQMIAALVTLVILSWRYADFTSVAIFVVAVGIAVLPVKFVKAKIRKKAGELSSNAGEIYKHISENLDAVAEVRSFNLEESQLNRHDTYLSAMEKFSLMLIKYQGLQQPIMEMLSVVVVSIMFVYTWYVKMPFSSFSAMGLALYFALDPVKKMSNMMGSIFRSQASMERVRYILDMPLDVKECANPIPVGHLQGNITFEKVQFAYSPEHPVLKGVSAIIPAGVSCALVGASGAGKSSFAKLISRFYDYTEGNISIDGISVQQMALKDLRRNIAIVTQFPVLFNDTIYNNLLIGKPDATEEEVYAAAQKAYAHDFIQKLPNGYQTMVGDRGDLLSGGQKQRIALARAFLKDAPILVLDEATSALDAQSEHYIQQALERLTKNKTVIIIAHRLSTIKNADMILVFDHGKIVDQGTHTELMLNSSLYQEYVHKQTAHITNPALVTA